MASASASASSSPSSPPPSNNISKKTQPLPWTHQETINLIKSYQHKWYSLNKGQLKSSQWEQVCLALASRCGFNHPSKSATQCRHKMEKLRKRYRAERLKPYPHSWPYFGLMDSMETGPVQSDDDDSDLGCNLNKSRSINRIVRGGDCRNMETDVRALGVSRNDVYDDGEDEQEGQGTRELAVQIRMFADNFVRMEQKKVQMMRETAKFEMEMENKRMKMIIESQRKIVDTIHHAFNTSPKKMRTGP
ncbi:hypothetical protein AgCh_033790 [Apium graveolens]